MDPSRRNQLSFGLELEFTFIFRYTSPEDAAPPENPYEGPTREYEASHLEADLLPDVMTSPVRFQSDGLYHIRYPGAHGLGDAHRLWAIRMINRVIASVPGARLAGGRTNSPGRPGVVRSDFGADAMHMNESGWNVTRDGTISHRHPLPAGYGHQNFELKSPALWDIPEAHQHVRDVLNALSSIVLWRVGPDAGFHVHVGSGPRYFEFHTFQRAAAILWAADGFLCHAHPVERNYNEWSPPISRSSRLATGLNTRYTHWPRNSAMHSRDNWDQQEEVREESFSLENYRRQPDPFPAAPADLASPNNHLRRYKDRVWPALRPQPSEAESREIFDAQRAAGGDNLSRHAGMPSEGVMGVLAEIDMTVEKGLRWIMQANSIGRIAGLLTHSNGATRHNYNLNSYVRDYRRGRNGRAGKLPTVEFREATSSMDPDWARHWPNICVGIFRFARFASDESFWNLLHNLNEADKAARAGRPHRYDMISMLLDMGLYESALYLEETLATRALRFWYPNCWFLNLNPLPADVQDRLLQEAQRVARELREREDDAQPSPVYTRHHDPTPLTNRFVSRSPGDSQVSTQAPSPSRSTGGNLGLDELFRLVTIDEDSNTEQDNSSDSSTNNGEETVRRPVEEEDKLTSRPALPAEWRAINNLGPPRNPSVDLGIASLFATRNNSIASSRSPIVNTNIVLHIPESEDTALEDEDCPRPLRTLEEELAEAEREIALVESQAQEQEPQPEPQPEEERNDDPITPEVQPATTSETSSGGSGWNLRNISPLNLLRGLRRSTPPVTNRPPAGDIDPRSPTPAPRQQRPYTTSFFGMTSFLSTTQREEVEHVEVEHVEVEDVEDAEEEEEEEGEEHEQYEEEEEEEEEPQIGVV
ncbi:hypothetical protein QBC35DRAFT_549726 [Podospora australis]|uniref:Amidoligase enzyme n=1 Tax=Podospora australis TaxID=1536484 RepID=A0AAN6X2T7_9PEZI|nr:hypothetical protein QBC35DRAFT_549726 [Podospora australis]